MLLLLITSAKATVTSHGHSSSVNSSAILNSSVFPFYFEEQIGAWCGMHVLNNLLQGPYVTQDACRLAANNVVRLNGDSLSNHLDLASGFLSIDVINVFGASVLGLHIEATSVDWQELQSEVEGKAIVNCNSQHWTVVYFDRFARS